ncbi:MAG: hypothetical protein ACLQSX_00900 [Smithella sp.]
MRDSLKEHFHSSNINFRNKLLRIICDHISGMTDVFALKEYRKMYC